MVNEDGEFNSQAIEDTKGGCARCGDRGHARVECRLGPNVQDEHCGVIGHAATACLKLGFRQYPHTPVESDKLNNWWVASRSHK